jgi:CHAT domain-containing protein/tetratricopeptide (TPR) repeat protein
MRAVVAVCILAACATQPYQDAKPDARTLRRLADSLVSTGLAHLRSEEPRRALPLLEESARINKELGRSDSLASSALRIAGIYYEQFKYDRAHEYLEQCRTLADSIELGYRQQLDLYFWLARCKIEMRDSLSARSAWRVGNSLVNAEDLEGRCRSLRTLAAIEYMRGAYPQAKRVYLAALDLAPDTNLVERAQVLQALGTVSTAMGDSSSAVAYYWQSLRNRTRAAGPSSNEVAIACMNLGSAYLNLGAHDSALHYLKRNLMIKLQVFGEKDVNTWGAKYMLGHFFLADGKPDSAVRYFHSGLTSLVHRFGNSDMSALPVPAADEVNNDLVLGLVSKAQALIALYNKDRALIRHLKSALSTFKLADSVAAVFRESALYEDSQLTHLASGIIPHERMIEVVSLLCQAEPGAGWEREALAIMEKDRSVILGQTLIQAQLMQQNNWPPEIQSEYRHLLRQRSALVSALSPGTSQVNRDSILRVISEVDLEFQYLLNEVSRTASNRMPSVDGPDRLFNLLEDQEAVLLEYLVAEDTISIVSVSSGSVRLKRIASSQVSAAAAELLRQLSLSVEEGAKSSNYESYAWTANLLYKLLIGDVLPFEERQGRRLVISADGILGLIPFEALLSRMPDLGEVDYSSMAYLFLEHPVSYCLSAGSWMEQTGQEKEGSRILAMGYGTESGAGELASLAGTVEEVVAIKAEAGEEENVYLLDAEARESSFKEFAPDFDVLHLAVHGKAEPTALMRSRLVFRSDRDSIDNGELTVSEIYDLDLRGTDMAVLSACESGIGEAYEGEGLMSIARAFAVAGCPSLVMSLWKVNDEAAAKLMAAFYREFLAGMDIDGSLGAAKRAYLEQAGQYNAHPSTWAAFVAVGSSRGLESERPGWVSWVLGLAVVFMVVALIQRKVLSQSP